LADLGVDVFPVDKVLEVEMCEHSGWNVLNPDSDVFGIRKWSVQVEILDIHGHKLGTWGGKDTVEQ
jgi:hypothetical protein